MDLQEKKKLVMQMNKLAEEMGTLNQLQQEIPAFLSSGIVGKNLQLELDQEKYALGADEIISVINSIMTDKHKEIVAIIKRVGTNVQLTNKQMPKGIITN